MAKWGTQGWWPTTNTRLAAALSVLGLIVRTDAQVDERTGSETRRIYLSLEPADRAMHRGTGHIIQTRRIVREINDGTLPRTDPTHPTLCGLAALANRQALTDWLKTGQSYRLHPLHGGPLHVLRPADSPVVVDGPPPPYVRVHEITIASALAAIGVDVLRLSGSPDAQTIDLAATTPDIEPVAALIQTYRARELPDDSPLFAGIQAIWNYHAIVAALRDEMPTILLRKPRSRLAAVVRPDITPKGLDLVRRKFNQSA